MSAHTAGLELTADEAHRYSRHLLLPELGSEGQQRLKAASVLLVGAGGLGSPVALYLAAAGVGRIGLVDDDRVDATNLQRQVLYGTRDVGRRKLDAARERLLDLNPHVEVELHDTRLTSANARSLVSGYDVVIDGTDNFPTRYLVNDVCVFTGRPNVYASIFRFEGQASVFGVAGGPCYRCLFPSPPPPGLVPSCAEGGVLGVLPGLLGTIQATEAIKVITGIGTPLVGRLLMVDALTMQFRTLRAGRDPECPVCGDHVSQRELIDYEAFCGVTPAAQHAPASDDPAEITPAELAARRAAGRAPFVLDVRHAHEAAAASLGADLLIPLPELQKRLNELAPYRDAEVVVHCHSGARSARAAELLRAEGFGQVRNLRGGLVAWRAEVEATRFS